MMKEQAPFRADYLHFCAKINNHASSVSPNLGEMS